MPERIYELLRGLLARIVPALREAVSEALQALRGAAPEIGRAHV